MKIYYKYFGEKFVSSKTPINGDEESFLELTPSQEEQLEDGEIDIVGVDDDTFIIEDVDYSVPEDEEEDLGEPDEDPLKKIEELSVYKEKIEYDAFTKNIEDFVYSQYSERKQGQDVMWLTYFGTIGNPTEEEVERASKIKTRMFWARETIEAFKNGEEPKQFPS